VNSEPWDFPGLLLNMSNGVVDMRFLKFLLKRLLTIAISMVVVIVITYVLMWLAPGNFFELQRVRDAIARVTTPDDPAYQATLKGFEERYGLNNPLWKQILMYLKGAVVFKFGPSFSDPARNIEDLIKEKFPITFTLALSSILFALVVGVPLGILAALKKNTWIDYTAMTVSVIGVAIPSYVVAVFLILIFSIYLGWLPTSGWEGIRTKILPTIALALGPLASVARFTRVSLLDTLNQDFIRTAYAKGGDDRTVIMKHALRPSMIPLVTIIGPQMAYLMVGTVWVENVFRIPGLGQLFANAAVARDYPLLVTSTFILALAVMIMNLIVDVLYAILDPRIKLD